MKNSIRIKLGKLPMQFMLIGFVLIVLSVFSFFENQIIGIILIFPGIAIIALREGIEIDSEIININSYLNPICLTL
jgi:hypothetical protein